MLCLSLTHSRSQSLSLSNSKGRTTKSNNSKRQINHLLHLTQTHIGSALTVLFSFKTKGDFAYTREGLLNDDFLEECISMTRNPQQHHHFYCKSCPLEKVKNDDCLEPCKGHLKRQFIKECWSKCGCHRQCGNRVVQRGLNCKLQVIFTSEGLRTLEDLPKCAFVHCSAATGNPIL